MKNFLHALYLGVILPAFAGWTVYSGIYFCTVPVIMSWLAGILMLVAPSYIYITIDKDDNK